MENGCKPILTVTFLPGRENEQMLWRERPSPKQQKQQKTKGVEKTEEGFSPVFTLDRLPLYLGVAGVAVVGLGLAACGGRKIVSAFPKRKTTTVSLKQSQCQNLNAML